MGHTNEYYEITKFIDDETDDKISAQCAGGNAISIWDDEGNTLNTRTLSEARLFLEAIRSSKRDGARSLGL